MYVVALLVIATASVGICQEQQTQTLLVVDEAAVSATFKELHPDWSVTVQVEGDEKQLARSGYVLWGAYADNDRSSQVLLTDGTVLVGDLVRIGLGSVTIASRLWGELEIDRRLLRASVMLPAVNALKRDLRWRSLQEPETADRILLLNGDTIAGRLLPTEKRDDGELFGLESIGIELLGSGSSSLLRMEEVREITFAARAERVAQPECLLGFRDGSLAAAANLTQISPELTQITTAAGVSLRLSTTACSENLTFIQPRSETIRYLSDLPAVGYKSLALLALDWPLGVAANTLGGRLRFGGNIIFQGLGMHSASRVAYDLDQKYRRFEAELALDEHAERRGSVVYRVLVERESEMRQRAWQLAFTSPIIRGGDKPLSMSVDVADATRLALVVEMADRVDTRDYANWLNARLVARAVD